MEIIRKAVELPRLKYYETHLSIINALLPIRMTPKELEVLAHFMALEGELAQYRFGPTARKVVMGHLELSPAGLSNHISSLRDKKMIREEGNLRESTHIWEILIPEDKEQSYMLKIIKAEE